VQLRRHTSGSQRHLVRDSGQFGTARRMTGFEKGRESARVQRQTVVDGVEPIVQPFDLFVGHAATCWEAGAAIGLVRACDARYALASLEIRTPASSRACSTEGRRQGGISGGFL
jgi:hypothetical protein